MFCSMQVVVSLLRCMERGVGEGGEGGEGVARCDIMWCSVMWRDVAWCCVALRHAYMHVV